MDYTRSVFIKNDKPVRTRYGTAIGRRGKYGRHFFGIPYAQAPVGNLRWKAPGKALPWPHDLDTSFFPPRAIQCERKSTDFYFREFYSDPAFTPPLSEDCLYLNIWAPEHATGCPVAVFFHGGAMISGWNSEIEFDGEEYARRGIILVTVSYRLGFPGFFAHPALADEKNDSVCSGNYGLFDQLAAIDWIRENIEAFGGDPGNITLMGQSAGAMCVRALMTSPAAIGKFQRAILQSGGGMNSRFTIGRPLIELEEACIDFLKMKRLSLQDFTCLPGTELAKLGEEFVAAFSSILQTPFPLSAVTDGYLFPMTFDNAVEKSASSLVPCLLSCTADDLWVEYKGQKNPEENYLFRENEALADALNKAGISCHRCYFAHPLPGDGAGAFHSSELWYMFGTLGRSWRPMTEGDFHLSAEMLDAWAAFMKDGNPGWAEDEVKTFN